MDNHFDELISAAAPPVADRSDVLMRELRGMAVDAEAAAAPRTRRRLAGVVGAVGVAVIGVVGAGAAANAAGLVPASWTGHSDPVHKHSTLTSGAKCEDTYVLHDLRDPAHPVSASGRTAARAAAEVIMQKLDVSKIDEAKVLGDFIAGSNRVKGTDTPVGPDNVTDMIEPLAVRTYIEDQLNAELHKQGLSTHAITMESTGRCEGGDGK